MEHDSSVAWHLNYFLACDPLKLAEVVDHLNHILGFQLTINYDTNT